MNVQYTNYLVSTRHELTAGRGTEGLDIVVLQSHPLRSQSVHVGGSNPGPVVPDVVEAIVVSQHEHNVGSRVHRANAAP